MTDNSKKLVPNAAPVIKDPDTSARRGVRSAPEPVRDRRDAGRVIPDPATLRPGSLAHRSALVGAAVAGVRRIRLPEPRQLGIHAEFDEIRITGLHMQGMPMLGMTLFEVTGAGKTTTAEEYAKRVNADAEDGIVPVLHIRLDNSGTARSLYVEMLAKLGDGFALNGTEHSLRRRTLEALRDSGTQLVIIDESNHGGKKSGFGGEITSSVKLLLDGGVVPVALLGTEEAVPIFSKDMELSGRLTAPCHLGRLEWHDPYDQEIWRGFLANLDQRLVDDGILAKTIGLDDEGLDRALNEACNGIIGQLMGTIRTAVRNTVRDSRDAVTLQDLITAVDSWNVDHKFISYNPLRDL
ncbi:TniB family NTP-binding protein [Sphingomonas sp. S1-29]|uniref:TniB family NTP-binding protein n=1 Tax=Sphingomonas sp. S1-29 TaxID=2991074 RepID=UPI00223FC5AC|nr:TniB family NTP-binding protein [Sphingomonas sp. S1-29]UZK68772.1 TniB family NTP-binding protein [Sphingomonas sp. S1-29]